MTDKLKQLLKSDFLACPLCQKTYTDPLILPCMHSACQQCIQQQVSQNSEGSSFLCTVCKADTPTPTNGHGKLRNNYFLAFLCELAACYDTDLKHCEYCSYVNKTAEAICRCIECRDNLCEVCMGAHRRTKLTRGHRILTFEEISTGNHDEGLRNNQQIFCSDHEAEAVKYLCQGCDKLICRECKVSTHEKHVCLELEAAANKYRNQTKAIVNHVDDKIPGLVEYSLFLKDYMGHVEDSKSKMIDDIEAQAEVLHQMIDAHKASMIDQMESSANQEKENIATRSTECEDVTNKLKSAVHFVEKLLEYGKDDEVMSLRKVVSEYMSKLSHTSIEPLTNKLSLYYSQGTATQSNMEGIFGKVDIFHVPLNDKNVAAMTLNEEFSAKLEGLNVATTPLPTLGEDVSEVLAFESKGSRDSKDIWPTGVEVDTDGNILVLDRDNKRVKVFDDCGKLIREFGHNGLRVLQCPYDLTIMRDGNIAVTDYEDEDVKIFTQSGAYIRSIKANFKYPRGITTNQQGELIVVDCHSHRLTVHDTDGIIIQDISGQDEEHCELFTDPYYVTTNTNGYIIVTDWSAPNIKFFDASGKYLTTYGTYGNRQDQVLQPYGVCTDRHGYVFVADNQNHRIHLLAPNGKFVRFLVTKQHGLWHPMAVTINNNGDLLVTEALGKVKVFKYM